MNLAFSIRDLASIGTHASATCISEGAYPWLKLRRDLPRRSVTMRQLVITKPWSKCCLNSSAGWRIAGSGFAMLQTMPRMQFAFGSYLSWELLPLILKVSMWLPFSPVTKRITKRIDFRPQGDGGLGKRLELAFEQGFEDGYSSIAVIGTDCPSCGARWINTAFARLESASYRDGIIGPSEDGGYYLLALQLPCPMPFS